MYALDDETTTLSPSTSSGTPRDEELLHSLIEEHAKETGSLRAKEILADWEHYKSCFKKIIPNDYLKIMTEIYAEEVQGKEHEEAVLDAFRKCTA